MLKEGRTFEKAIARFTDAAQKDPTNADYQIALGCACASRAASLAWAGVFAARLAADTAAYPKLLALFAEKEAERRQEFKDKNASAKERAEFDAELQKVLAQVKPPMGRVFLTKDDKAPFRLTPSELSARLTDLIKDATAAWDKGVALCRTPEEKAHALYVRGWGLWLLRFYCDSESEWRQTVELTTMGTLNSEPENSGKDKVAPLDIKGLPTGAQIAAAFKEANEAAPNVALYWQARADWSASHERADPEKEATDLYRRAATLEPKNALLWSHVYDRETTKPYGNTPTGAPPDDEILADLHQAQARDKSNAWYGYEEAGRLLKTTSWNKLSALRYDASEKEKQAARDTQRTEDGYAAAKRAVARIERANSLPRFAPPEYRKSITPLLQTAWSYVPTHWYEYSRFTYQARFRELARTGAAYAESLAEEKKNIAEALRVLRVLRAMGLRLMGDPWPTGRDASGKIIPDDKSVVRALSTWSLVSITYGSLVTIAKASGDADFLETATEEQTQWKTRLKQWTTGLPLQDDEPSIYEAYDRNE